MQLKSFLKEDKDVWVSDAVSTMASVDLVTQGSKVINGHGIDLAAYLEYSTLRTIDQKG